MTNVEENRIIASNLCYCYPEAQKNAVDDVSMRVKKGEFLAILGHNGSGKSTLAKLFNALYVPGSGTVWVCGMDTKDDDLVFDIRQHAGMVFQNPDNQIVATVVEEDVAFGLENNGVPPKEIRVRIDEIRQESAAHAFRRPETARRHRGRAGDEAGRDYPR